MSWEIEERERGVSLEREGGGKGVEGGVSEWKERGVGGDRNESELGEK